MTVSLPTDKLFIKFVFTKNSTSNAKICDYLKIQCS